MPKYKDKTQNSVGLSDVPPFYAYLHSYATPFLKSVR